MDKTSSKKPSRRRKLWIVVVFAILFVAFYRVFSEPSPQAGAPIEATSESPWERMLSSGVAQIFVMAIAGGLLWVATRSNREVLSAAIQLDEGDYDRAITGLK